MPLPVVEESIRIERPRSEVFDFLTDLDCALVWQSNLVEIARAGEGPLRKGTRSRGISRVAGLDVKWETEVTEVHAPESFEFRSVECAISFCIAYHLEPVCGVTRVDFRIETGDLGDTFGDVAESLAARLFARDVRSNLGNLKEILESRRDV